jgi:hypothetical protein
MAFRIRKSIKLFPGVRLNISGSGVSANIGVRGANVSVGPKGSFINVGVPGTGVGYREKVGTSDENPPPSVADGIPESSSSRPLIWFVILAAIVVAFAFLAAK